MGIVWSALHRGRDCLWVTAVFFFPTCLGTRANLGQLIIIKWRLREASHHTSFLFLPLLSLYSRGKPLILFLDTVVCSWAGMCRQLHNESNSGSGGSEPPIP